jgi:hypothetical protein
VLQRLVYLAVLRPWVPETLSLSLTWCFLPGDSGVSSASGCAVAMGCGIRHPHGSAQRISASNVRRQSATPPGRASPPSRASLAGSRRARVPAPVTYPPCECRLPAGCTERNGIGIGPPGAPSAPAHEV